MGAVVRRNLVSPVLVGRDNELAALTEALDAAVAGEPSVVIVSGEAGVGKTRLVEETADRAREKDVRVLTGTHGLHVTFGLVWLVTLMTQVARFGLIEANRRRLMCLSMFWHFLDVVWIGVFTFVYLMGMLR